MLQTHLSMYSDCLNIIIRFIASLLFIICLQINNNGIISFNHSFGCFLPNDLPLNCQGSDGLVQVVDLK